MINRIIENVPDMTVDPDRARMFIVYMVEGSVDSAAELLNNPSGLSV